MCLKESNSATRISVWVLNLISEIKGKKEHRRMLFESWAAKRIF
jgi:hypothetical protein